MLIKFTCVFYHIQNYCIFLTGKDIALLNFVNQAKRASLQVSSGIEFVYLTFVAKIGVTSGISK